MMLLHHKCPNNSGQVSAAVLVSGGVYHRHLAPQTPQWGLDSKSAIRAANALVANDAVAHSCLKPSHLAPSELLRLAPFVHSSFPRSTKFCSGSFRRDCPLWLLGLSSSHTVINFFLSSFSFV
jgi:hypothetical protein